VNPSAILGQSVPLLRRELESLTGTAHQEMQTLAGFTLALYSDPIVHDVVNTRVAPDAPASSSLNSCLYDNRLEIG